jgi:hypothetical protein
MEKIMPKSIAEGAALIIAEAALAISEGKFGRTVVRTADQDITNETPLTATNTATQTKRG